MLLGVGIGLAAGLSPGPLLALVVSSTLRRGFVAGVRVSMAPLITDAPIVALTVAVVDALPESLLRALALGGAAYLLWLAARSLRSEPATDPGDLRQGVAVNLLSPHPWLFWLGAGAPILRTAWERAPGRAVAFVAGFYALLVGTKVAVAALMAAARPVVLDRWYGAIRVVAAALLAAAAAVVVVQVVLSE